MSWLYSLARPLLFRLDAEKAHDLTLKALESGLIRFPRPFSDKRLEVNLWNRKFPTPLGLAAGFDKNAAVIEPMLRCGFGFVEAGTVTPRPQTGNPKPRIFRCPEHGAIINAMGFPNEGLAVFKENFQRYLETRPLPAGQVGINIGMNKGQKDPVKDYRVLIRHLGPLADYLVVNISSPNTKGLRDLQKEEHLRPLLEAIMAERARSCGSVPPPLLVKLAPDLEKAQQEEIAKIIMAVGIDGLILTNTTISRSSGLPPKFREHKGGLSGRPLKSRATEIIHSFYQLTDGKIPIIGLGGITSATDAYEKIRAGASLVQLYSALVFQGPDVVRQINTGLIKLIEQDGLTHIRQAVGAAHKGNGEDHPSENKEKPDTDKKALA